MITLKTDEQSKKKRYDFHEEDACRGILLFAACNSRIIDFTIIPVIVSLILSFTSYNVIGDFKFTGIDNFTVLIFTDDLFSKSVVVTFTAFGFWQYAKIV